MSVHEVKEDFRGLVYDNEVDAASMQKSGRAVRTFDVTFTPEDDLTSRPALARSAPGIPQVWETWPGDDWMFVNRIGVAPGNGPMSMKVTVSYTSIANPLEQDWDVSWGYQVTAEPIDRDIEGNPITNSAKETPNPPMTEDVHDLILRVRRNEDHFNPLLAHSYSGAINNDLFLGFNPSFCKCHHIEGKRSRAADLIYWKVNYELHFRLRPPIPGVPEIGWIHRFLDQGMRELGDDGESLTIITDADDKQLPQPSLLDGLGKVLAKDADAVFLEYKTRRELPFSVLNLVYS